MHACKWHSHILSLFPMQRLWRNIWLVASLYKRPIYSKNGISRKSVKNRQITTQSTSSMRDFLEMIHMYYQKNWFINVREVAFWKKFMMQINKQINKIVQGRWPSYSKEKACKIKKEWFMCSPKYNLVHNYEERIVFPTCARAGGYRIPCVPIMTLQLISCVTIYITIFWRKWNRSPNLQKAPYCQAEHKPNVGPPRNYICVIWKESDYKCRTSSILKKVYCIHKQINK